MFIKIWSFKNKIRELSIGDSPGMVNLVGRSDMAFNDSLSDMLARIKNAHRARKSITSCHKSNLT